MVDAPRSETALQKHRTQRTTDGFPVHSFRTFLASLGTLVKNRVIPRGGDQRAAFDLLTEPTPLSSGPLTC